MAFTSQSADSIASRLRAEAKELDDRTAELNKLQLQYEERLKAFNKRVTSQGYCTAKAKAIYTAIEQHFASENKRAAAEKKLEDREAVVQKQEAATRALIHDTKHLINRVGSTLAGTHDDNLAYLQALVALHNIEHPGAETTLEKFVKDAEADSDGDVEIKDW